MSDDNNYPDWLCRKLIGDKLPWDKKTDLNIETFVMKYTLHDSYWVGIFHHIVCDQSATLAFQWDPVWLPDNVMERSSRGTYGPFLFIKIDKVDQLSFSNFKRMAGRAISDMEYEIIEGRKYIAIYDIFGGRVDIIFSGNVSFLALDRNDKILNI